MATTAIGKGRLVKCHLVDEATFGTPPASGWQPTVYYTHTLQQKRPRMDNPLIGANLHNGNDATRSVQDLPDEGGDIVVPVDLAHFGLWLKLLLGAPTTSGTTNYTHAFSSGGATLPTRDLEFENGASDFHQHVGLAGKRMSIEMSDKGGHQQATVSLIGKKRTLLTATGVGTPDDLMALDPLVATLGTLLIDTVAAGRILSCRLDFDTGSAVERFVDGDPYASGISLGDDATFTGEIRVRYSGTTLEAAADGDTEKALEFKWTKGANNSLSIAAGAAVLEPGGAMVRGPGGMEATFPFRASQTAAAAMLAVTLKNQIASY